MVKMKTIVKWCMVCMSRCIYSMYFGGFSIQIFVCHRVNVGTFGQCKYNRTLSYFLDNFCATSVVIAMCNPDKSQKKTVISFSQCCKFIIFGTCIFIG